MSHANTAQGKNHDRHDDDFKRVENTSPENVTAQQPAQSSHESQSNPAASEHSKTKQSSPEASIDDQVEPSEIIKQMEIQMKKEEFIIPKPEFDDDTGECTIEDNLMKRYGYENSADMPDCYRKITHEQYQNVLPAQGESQDDSSAPDFDTDKVKTEPVVEKRATAEVLGTFYGNFDGSNYEYHGSLFVEINNFRITSMDVRAGQIAFRTTWYPAGMRAIQTINRGKNDNIVEVVAVYQNNFYTIQYKVAPDAPAKLTQSIKVTNPDIIEWIQGDELQSMSVFGPESAKCYIILFGYYDLVLTNLTNAYHHMWKDTDQTHGIFANLVPMHKRDNSAMVVFTQQFYNPDCTKEFSVEYDKELSTCKPQLIQTIDGYIDTYHFFKSGNAIFSIKWHVGEYRGSVSKIEQKDDSLVCHGHKYIHTPQASSSFFEDNKMFCFQDWMIHESGRWFKIDENCATEIYQPDNDNNDGCRFVGNCDGSNATMLMIKHQSITVLTHLHSYSPYNLPTSELIHTLYDHKMWQGFLTEDVFFQYKSQNTDLFQHGIKLELIDENSQSIQIWVIHKSTEKQTMYFHRKDGRSYYDCVCKIDASQINNAQIKVTDIKVLKDDRQIMHSPSFLGIDYDECDFVVASKSGQMQSEIFNEQQIPIKEHNQSLSGNYYCLEGMLDAEVYNRVKDKIEEQVAQTKDLVIINDVSEKQLHVFQKQNIKVAKDDKGSLQPQILKADELLAAEDYQIEYKYQNSVFVYSADTKSIIDCYEHFRELDQIKNPSHLLYNNQFSNVRHSQKVLDRCPLFFTGDLYRRILQRSYNMFDYSFVKNLLACQIDKQQQFMIDKMSVKYLLVSYGNGYSFFHLFREQFQVIKTVLQLITGSCSAIQYEKKCHSEFQELDKNVLAFILNWQDPQGNLVFHNATKNFPIFEKLISILTMSNSIPVQESIDELFRYLIEHQSNPVLEFLSDKVFYPPWLRNIKPMHLPETEKESFTFTDRNAIVNDKQIIQHLNKIGDSFEKEKSDVVVTRLVFTMCKYKRIIEQLSNIDDKEQEQVFAKHSIMYFIDHLWENHYRTQIRYKLQAPFFSLLTFATIQFIWFLNVEDDSSKGREAIRAILSSINYLLSGYFLSLEVRQMMVLGRKYIDLWNIINCMQIIMTITTITFSLFDSGKNYTLSTIAALAIFVIYLNLFYIVRVNDDYAWFIMLLTKTVDDIKPMLKMYFICLCTFATTSTVLNQSRSSDTEVVVGAFDNQLLNSLLTQYLLSLGEFTVDEYDKGFNQTLLWLLFVASTMITMVVFMNMLIAQMGDTYDECQEKRTIIVYMNKIQLMQEFGLFVDVDFKDEKYLYVVQKKQAEGMEARSWEGKLVQQQRLFQREIKGLKVAMANTQKETRTMLRQSNDGVDQIQKTQLSDSFVKQEIKSVEAKIEAEIKSVEAKIKSVEAKIEGKIDSVQEEMKNFQGKIDSVIDLLQKMTESRQVE